MRCKRDGCIDESFNEAISPPSRRGGRADLTNVTLPQVIGAAGEVRHLLGFRQLFDLPPSRSKTRTAGEGIIRTLT